ncbi:MAG: ABC transporter ATP-binding protein [Pseudomonadota bacterium]
MLSLSGITKRFGTLAANDAISLEVSKGEIHALLGENGAGKSTLVKILYGALAPDEGEIRWKGKLVRFANPAAARAAGIGMVFQHFSLFDALNVAENVALALPGDRKLSEISKSLAEISRQYGLPLDPQAQIGDLSAGERQRVEIVRCLLANPELIIMDEPTSVLTPQEAEALFETLRKLRAEGRSILYISHKLEEVRALCESATILRHGKVVGTCDPRETSKADLAAMMVGASVADIRAATEDRAIGERALLVNGLSTQPASPFATALKDISFAVRHGTVSAIAGIAGNGQSELFACLSGETLTQDASTILLFEQPAGTTGINERRRAGAAFVSEERLGHGAAPTLSLTDNVVLTRTAADPEMTTRGFVRRSRARSIRETICDAFDVRRGSTDPAAGSLSGGNLQKFIVGREIGRVPDLIIIDQPTWGVDAGAAQNIRQTLIDSAENGTAILVISQDLDEIFEIADEIAVLFEGQLSPFVPVKDTNREQIGLLMGGEGFEPSNTGKLNPQKTDANEPAAGGGHAASA